VYNDTGLLYGQTYKYRVCAYADQYKSDYVTVDSVATTFPTPSNLTATATSDQSITLSWSDNCSFEDGYELWRKTGSGSFEIIDSTSANGTAYADSGLTYGETYSYKVRAYTTLNVSDYSGEESVAMSIPAPSGLTILQGDDTAILNWIDNSSFETGFSIEKSVEAAPFSEIGTVAGNTVNYTDIDVDAISQYRYRVRLRRTITPITPRKRNSVCSPVPSITSRPQGAILPATAPPITLIRPSRRGSMWRETVP